jgi:hypothetical protein
MCAVQWGTKVCLLTLYWRLTQNLVQNFVVKAAAAYVAVTYVVMEILYFAVWCRPFSDYWKTPTPNVQCSTALHHLIVNLSFNLSSDLLIMSIPLPLLIKAHLGLRRKILLIFPFTLGMFTIICAILSKHLSFTQPFSGLWVYWYCREASTAMIVANMPYSWSLIRRAFKLKSFFGDSSDEPVITLQGISHREASSVSTSVPAKTRSSLFFPGRKGGKNSTSAPGEAGMSAWQDGAELSRDSKSAVNTSTEVSSSSGSQIVKMQPPTDITTATLDKLYPLDDLDIELGNEKEV